MNNYVAQIVDELYELGIEDVVLSPGARSTPLAILFCEHKFNIYMDIDERSAAFFALGIAKAKNKAVVLVCTSGSACGHYLPAAIEAKHSRIPLIFLTADRPPELQNVGAPQTINQHNMFGDFVKYYEELAIDSSLHTSQQNSYARLVMQKAYTQVHANPRMAVHINVPLREPLVPELKELDFSIGRSEAPFEFMSGEVENKKFYEYFTNNYLGKNGLIICGPNSVNASADYYNDIISLSIVLNAPILADPLSQFRAYEHKNIITTYDAFLKYPQIATELCADYILLIGQSPVSKSLFNFIKNHSAVDILQLGVNIEYANPALNTAKIIQVCEWSFARAILQNKKPGENKSQEFISKWVLYQNKMQNCLSSAKNAELLFEGKIIQDIQDILQHTLNETPHQKVHLMIANSMSIRDMDLFWQARQQNIRFYGNRGANGIDGTISTALGLAAGTQNINHKNNLSKSTILITGDLALFHDLTGLLVGRQNQLNLCIVVLNNSGGGIFQYLPQSKTKNFEYLFLTPHDLDFSALAKLYNINHYLIKDYAEFDTVFSNSLLAQGIDIIEVQVDMQTSKELHALCQRIDQAR